MRRLFILPLLAFYTAVLFDLYERYKNMFIAPIAAWNPSFYLVTPFCLGVFAISIAGLWKPEWLLPLCRIRHRLKWFRWFLVIAAGLTTIWFFFFTVWSDLFSGNFAHIFLYTVTVVFMAWMGSWNDNKHFQASGIIGSATLFFGMFVLVLMLTGYNPLEEKIQTAIAQTQTAEPTETPLPTHTKTITPTPTDIPDVTSTPTQTPTPTPDPRVNAYEWVKVTKNAAFPPRDGAGALVFNNRMWLIGGWNPYDKENFPMDTNNEVWSSEDGLDWTLEKSNTFSDNTFDLASDWEGRHAGGYAVYKGKMWIVGGDPILNHYQPDVWNSEDGKNWTWVNEGHPVPWNPRVLHYTVVFQDKIWIMGGQTIPQLIPGNETYYSDIWTTSDGINWEHFIPNQPSWTARGIIAGSVVYNDRIWIIGGGTYPSIINRNRDYYNDVWSSADGINWMRHTGSAQWLPRQYHSVAVFDGLMWVLQGFNEGNMNDVWFSSDGVNWTELPNTPWAIRHAASIFVYDNSLWVVAGRNMQSDVWRLNTRNDN
jgi:hypothetical protein